MITPRPFDETLRGDILLMIYRDGERTIQQLTRYLGILPEDRLKNNLEILKKDGFIVVEADMVNLTDAGRREIRINYLKEIE